MAATSSIEWTDATWNPVTGCTRVSKGCDLCYAATLTRRLAAMGQEKYQGLINPGKDHFNGIVKTHPDTLGIPLRQKKKTMWFVNSMSDLFHKGVPEAFIVDVFEVMARTPRHIYQILTKRGDRMREIMPRVWMALSERFDGKGLDLPLANVWLGTSVEDEAVKGRIDDLAATPAAVRFLSCEPLLGPLAKMNLTGIHWVIIGGESGHGARPMNTQWAEDIIEQCRNAGVACFVKQLGARPYEPATGPKGWNTPLPQRSVKGGDPSEWPPQLRVREHPTEQMPEQWAIADLRSAV